LINNKHGKERYAITKNRQLRYTNWCNRMQQIHRET